MIWVSLLGDIIPTTTISSLCWHTIRRAFKKLGLLPIRLQRDPPFLPRVLRATGALRSALWYGRLPTRGHVAPHGERGHVVGHHGGWGHAPHGGRWEAPGEAGGHRAPHWRGDGGHHGGHGHVGGLSTCRNCSGLLGLALLLLLLLLLLHVELLVVVLAPLGVLLLVVVVVRGVVLAVLLVLLIVLLKVVQLLLIHQSLRKHPRAPLGVHHLPWRYTRLLLLTRRCSKPITIITLHPPTTLLLRHLTLRQPNQWLPITAARHHPLHNHI